MFRGALPVPLCPSFRRQFGEIRASPGFQSAPSDANSDWSSPFFPTARPNYSTDPTNHASGEEKEGNFEHYTGLRKSSGIFPTLWYSSQNRIRSMRIDRPWRGHCTGTEYPWLLRIIRNSWIFFERERRGKIPNSMSLLRTGPRVSSLGPIITSRTFLILIWLHMYGRKRNLITSGNNFHYYF
jgi:hypothetical protein